MSSLDEQILEARREAGYRKNTLGFACTVVNKTARQLSGLAQVGGGLMESPRGRRLLAELELAKASRETNREELARATGRLEKLLAERGAQA